MLIRHGILKFHVIIPTIKSSPKFSMASKPKPRSKPTQKPETATEDVDVDENPVTDGTEADQDGIYSTNYASEEMRKFDKQHGDGESSD